MLDLLKGWADGRVDRYVGERMPSLLSCPQAALVWSFLYLTEKTGEFSSVPRQLGVIKLLLVKDSKVTNGDSS
jgi:hypothetical protein